MKRIAIWYKPKTQDADNPILGYLVEEFGSAHEAQGWLYNNKKDLMIFRITSDDLVFKTVTVAREEAPTPPLPKGHKPAGVAAI